VRYKLVAAGAAVAAIAAAVLLSRFGPPAPTARERGLALYLPLNTDLADHSPFKRPVKVVGNVWLENGAARFGGEGSWLEVPHLPLDGRPFAISLWVKVMGNGPSYGLLEQLDAEQDNRHLHLVLSNDRPYFGFLNNDARAKKPVRKGVWNHLVFRFNGQEQDVWLNGQSILRSASPPYRGGKGETRIGRHPRLGHLRSATDLEGALREVRVYDVLVDADLIRALARDSPDGK
jgi:hypothetical protein